MHPVAFFDAILLISVSVSVFFLVRSGKVAFRRSTRFLLAALLVFMGFYGFCMGMEWSGITHSLETLEDLVGALVPMWWAFVLYGFVHEVTHRDIREGEEKYRSLVSNIPDVVWTAEEGGRLTFVSSNVERIYWFTAEEICSRGVDFWLDRVHPEEREAVKAAFGAIFADDLPLDIEYRTKRKDGEWIWLHLRSMGAYEKEGVKYADGVFSDVTERKRSLEDLERIFNLSGYMVCVADFEGNFKKISPSFEEVLGYSSEELLSEPYIHFVHPEDKARTISVVEEKLSVGVEIMGFENRYRCKDGSYKWLGWSSRPVLEEGVMFAIAHDITERKTAEEEVRAANEQLRSSEEKFRSLVGNVPGVVYRCKNDHYWTMQFMSDLIVEISGHPASDFIENKVRTFASIIHPEDRETVWNAVQKGIEKGEAFSLEYRIICAKGETRWVYEGGRGVVSEGGECDYLDGVLLDVTDRKLAEEEVRTANEQLHALNEQMAANEQQLKAANQQLIASEKELRRSEEEYRRIVEDQTEFIVRWLPDGVRTFVNESYCRYYDVSREDAIGSSFLPLISEEDREFVRKRVEGLSVENPVSSGEHRVVRPDGSMGWNSWTDRAIFDDEGALVEYQSVGHDITERKLAEEKIRAANERLIAANQQLAASEQELRESRHLLDATINNSPAVIYVKDLDGRYLLVNKTYEKIVARSFEEMEGKTDEAIFPKDVAEKFRANDLLALESDLPLEFEEAALHASGEVHTYISTKFALRDENGAAYAICGISADITQRKRVEDAIGRVVSQSASSVGQEFLDGMARQLCEVLGADCSLIGETMDEELTRVSTKSVCCGGEMQANFEYELTGTPCENVVGKKPCSYPTGVCEKFPDDIILQDMGVDGYVGVPLFGSQGEAIGLMAALFERRVEDLEFAESILELFAARTVGEIVRMHAEQAVEEQLAFETLVAGLSGKFINLPAEMVDKEIKQGICEVVEFLGVDRGGILEFSEDQSELCTTHVYATPGVKAIPVVDVASKFPWLTKQLRRGETVCISRPEDIPEEAVAERNFFQEEGQRAVLMTPLKVGGSILGVLTVGALGGERSWSDETVLRLQLVGGIFGNALMRMRTENALRDSEERYRAVVEDQTELICRNLPDSTLTFVNDAYCRYFGKSRDSLIGEKFMPVVPEDDRQKVVEHFACLGRDNPVATYEHRIIMPGGEIRWHQWTNRAVFDDDGNVFEFQGAGRDITDRKEAEKALRKSEERFHKAFDSSPIAVVISRLEDGRFIAVNEAAARVLGYTSDEIIGKASDELNVWVIPADRDKMVEELRGDGKVRDMEVQFRRKSGEIRDIVLSAETIELEGSNCIVTAAKDVTEQKKAQEALHESVAKYRSLFEAAADAIITMEVTGADLAIIDCNRSTEKLFGCRREEMLGMSPPELSPEFQPDGTTSVEKAKQIVAAFMVGGPRRFEWVHRRFDDSLFDAEVSIGRVNVGDRVYMQAIVRDITDRKLLEDQERKHHEQLIHFSRLTVAGELASGMAHELNQPLTAITTYAQACQRMIDSGNSDSPKVREATSEIAAQAMRGGEIIRRMRTFVRKQNPQRVSVDFNEIVREALGLVQMQAKRDGVTLQIEFSEEPLMVLADKIQIQQVLVNLLQNGFDAMEDVAMSERVLKVRTSRTSEDTVEIAVEDRGVGLSSEDSKRIFESFFTTKSEGLGIGLSISRSIVEEHDGHIWAEPNVDKGATFKVALPLEKV